MARTKDKRMMAPAHIALIPDGNRRWAMKNKFSILSSYRRGISKFEDFIRWSKEFGVNTVTVWALSTENFKNRTATELKVLFYLYAKVATDKRLLKTLAEEHARVVIVGNVSVLPKRLKEAFRSLERKTLRYRDFTINVLVNYGGRDDLTYAMSRIKEEEKKAGKPVRISEDYVREHLRTSGVPDVDLIVRTSGEMRLSGLLPWQAAYSELYFADKYWPDFDKNDFRMAMETYSRRSRRFGK